MLLEESLLYLLRVSGYKTIDDASHDPATLHNGHSGLEVIGRACSHQIDAVADYHFCPPFSHPQRLLLEAKCYTSKVGIDVIRNGLGVLKDVDEFWTGQQGGTPIKRYHYQYSIFSTSGYSSGAEVFAYVHDIYLFPLQRSAYMKPIIDSIVSLTPQTFGTTHNSNIPINQGQLRQEVRKLLKEERPGKDYISAIVPNDEAVKQLREIVKQCHRLQGALLATLNRRYPVFLAPNPEVIDLDKLENSYVVRITRDDKGWYLNENTSNSKRLFSFDLPDELLKLYTSEDRLTTHQAAQIKQDLIPIQALTVVGGETSIITFKLDPRQLEELRQVTRTASHANLE